MPEAGKIEQVLDENDKGEYIDVRGVAESLRISIHDREMNDDTLVGVMFRSHRKSEEKTPRILNVKPGLSYQEQNTVIAILLAKYCLYPEFMDTKGYRLNIFEMKTFRETRFSRLMYMATRMALPESVIEQINDVKVQHIHVEATEHFLSEFIYSTVKGHTIQFLLDNDIVQ